MTKELPTNWHRRIAVTFVISITIAARASAQQTPPPKDTIAPILTAVQVTAKVAPKTVTSLPDHYGALLFTGKKPEVILVNSRGANTAQNRARQALGPVPSLLLATTHRARYPPTAISLPATNL